MVKIMIGAVVAAWGAFVAWWISPYSERRKERARERARVIADVQRACFASMELALQKEWEPQWDNARAQHYGGVGNRNFSNLNGSHAKLKGVIDKRRYSLPGHYWLWANTFVDEYEALGYANSAEEYEAALRQCLKSYRHIAGRAIKGQLERMEIHSENQNAITNA